MRVNINQRVCHFVTANIALNELGHKLHATRGNLYAPFVGKQQNTGKTYQDDLGTFTRILCNPPFVTAPNMEDMKLQ